MSLHSDYPPEALQCAELQWILRPLIQNLPQGHFPVSLAEVSTQWVRPALGGLACQRDVHPHTGDTQG